MYTRGCYITNVNVLCLVVSDKKIFHIDSYSERASSQAGPLNIPVCPKLNKIGRGVLGDVA